ncbi:MAG: hypothetical protein HY791_11110 [Deltaproteobacteria bacterium]|nr:hypothetical protein [Deltaproteobacteria bacterium]
MSDIRAAQLLSGWIVVRTHRRSRLPQTDWRLILFQRWIDPERLVTLGRE